MKSKKIIISFLAVLFIAAACFSIYYVNQSLKKLQFDSCQFEESPALLQNPYQGFYNMYGFSLTDDDNMQASTLAETITEDDNLLALLEINLKNFRDRDLSDAALSQLETLLSSCENAGKKLIIRFLYDWDGRAQDTEPSDISQILSHMSAVSSYINSHKNTVYILQGIFVGNYGEMNNSIYLNEENMLTLINHLNGCVDNDIFLAVRTPAHYRIINNRINPLQSDEAYCGSLASRLSLFNDGMLGSDTDLGTYGTSSNKGSQSPNDKGTREEEIAFQNKLCSFVPNGGECVIDNPFNDFDNAVTDLNAMNVSYLNCGYDADVLNKWKNTTYSGDDVFDGTNGYDYISAHLGYRYTVTDTNLQYNRFKSRTASLNINIKNTGFSPAYKKFDCKILLEGTDTFEYIADYDNRTLLSGSEGVLSVDIDTSDIPAGTYNVYFVMTYPTTYGEAKIKLANTGYFDEYGLPLGQLTIE